MAPQTIKPRCVMAQQLRCELMCMVHGVYLFSPIVVSDRELGAI